MPRWVKQIIQTVHAEGETIQESIKRQEGSSSQAANTCETRQREAVGIIASAIKTAHEDVPIYEKAQRNREFGQSRKMVWAAWFTFGAAFAYGAVATWQGFLMHRTYKEIHSQTRVAMSSEYMSCLNAQAAQRAVEQSQALALASIEQATAATESQIGRIAVSSDKPATGIRNRLVAAYHLRNEGGSDATDISMIAVAKMLNMNQIPGFTYDSAHIYKKRLSRLEKGHEYPLPGDNPHNSLVSNTINVIDEGGFVNSNPVILSALARSEKVVLVYGKLTYFDFSGQHKATFCIPLYNAVGSSKSEGIRQTIDPCDAYNNDRDRRQLLYRLSGSPMAAPIDCDGLKKSLETLK